MDDDEMHVAIIQPQTS